LSYLDITPDDRHEQQMTSSSSNSILPLLQISCIYLLVFILLSGRKYIFIIYYYYYYYVCLSWVGIDIGLCITNLQYWVVRYWIILISDWTRCRISDWLIRHKFTGTQTIPTTRNIPNLATDLCGGIYRYGTYRYEIFSISDTASPTPEIILDWVLFIPISEWSDTPYIWMHG
jgi:hypothetical protein